MKVALSDEKEETVTLDFRQRQRLLEDIESSDQLYKHFFFLSHCNSNPQIYGKAGLPLRRAFQTKLNKLKALVPTKYLATLKKHQVKPGPQLLRHIEDIKGKKNIVAEEERKTKLNHHNATMTKEQGLNDTFDRLSMTDDRKPAPSTPLRGPSHSATASGGTTTPLFSPVNRGTPVLAVPSPNFGHVHVPAASISSPFVPTTIYEGSQNGYDRRDQLVKHFLADAKARENGSFEHPFVIKADYIFPERNQGMNINLVANVEEGDYMNVAFVIRKIIDPPDKEAWSASIPAANYMLANEYGLDKSLVLIKGPSLSYWLRDTSKFHMKSKEVATVKAAHSVTEIAMDADPKRRKYSYTLVVFTDKDVRLDNKQFSGGLRGNEGKIARKLVPVTQYDKASKTTFIGLATVWKIGWEGKSEKFVKETNEEPEEETFKDLFG